MFVKIMTTKLREKWFLKILLLKLKKKNWKKKEKNS